MESESLLTHTCTHTHIHNTGRHQHTPRTHTHTHTHTTHTHTHTHTSRKDSRSLLAAQPALPELVRATIADYALPVIPNQTRTCVCLRVSLGIEIDLRAELCSIVTTNPTPISLAPPPPAAPPPPPHFALFLVFSSFWFWYCFGVLVLVFRDGFGMVLGWFWDGFGMVLGWFWDGFGMVLGWFWDGFAFLFVIVYGWYCCFGIALWIFWSPLVGMAQDQNNTKQYQTIPNNTKQYQTIPNNTKQYQNNTKIVFLVFFV